jgi:hypothetical protein
VYSYSGAVNTGLQRDAGPSDNRAHCPHFDAMKIPNFTAFKAGTALR